MKNVTSMMQRYDHFGNQVLLTTQRNDKFIARRFDHLLKPTSRLISKQKSCFSIFFLSEMKCEGMKR